MTSKDTNPTTPPTAEPDLRVIRYGSLLDLESLEAIRKAVKR